ncbi:MFS transporter [Rhodococcus sp. NPDC019609]|uniref:MFS transporter n=1 Tax=unclassified Rhodococcus (in: high G+C Gram-positive bacteria) TaxID=192944 RepID=UPI0037AED9F3
MEYYDFVVYGYVAVYIAHAYFPSDNPLVGLLLTFGAFAASYVARPLGAVIFSPLGDKYGRKTVLAVVILMMTLATAAIGLLPTYAQIGLFAPILLTVLRVLQGISAGGEYGGATSLIAEFSPPDKRGFYVGFIALTTGLALLTGSIVALSLTRMLPEESMLSWGWRIPLLLSLPLGLVGLYIRFKLEETPHFAALSSQEKAVNKPLATTVKRDYRTVVLAIGLAATNASLLAVYFIYLPSALKQFGNFRGRRCPTHHVLGTGRLLPGNRSLRKADRQDRAPPTVDRLDDRACPRNLSILPVGITWQYCSCCLGYGHRHAANGSQCNGGAPAPY